VALGRGQHLLQSLARALVVERRDPAGELVADALELAEREQPRTAAGARRAAGAQRLAAREGRGQLERELAFQPRDLVAQVAPRGRLTGDRGRGARADRRFGGDDGGQGTCLLSGRNVPLRPGGCRGRRSGRPP
jgi:hypothetical protein